MKKSYKVIISIIVAIVIILTCFKIKNIEKSKQDELNKNEINQEIKNEQKRFGHISIYNMTEEQIKKLPSNEIQIQSEEEEKKVSEEQIVEDENFKEQGEIAYNGTNEFPSVNLGSYVGLTYYSQIDNRWKNNMYSSIADTSQTIGTSGCGPTAAAMIVTAIKGTISPPEMANLFTQYGYRSRNQGTYWSAFRFVADTFNIEYQETSNFQNAVQLVKNQNYVVVSCANGLFTTGGHFVVITGIEGDTLKIYDPYLYTGKFETSTRRGKVKVDGNTVYCSIENFMKYANYKAFFVYKHDSNVQENQQPVIQQGYVMYVNTKKGLNIRNSAGGKIVGALSNGTKINVYENNGNWSRIGTNQWVYSSYLKNYTSNYYEDTKQDYQNQYTNGNYKVVASVLNVRAGAGTQYRLKTWKQLTINARIQNKKLGNEYTNGLRYGTVITVTKVKNEFGLIPSGWVCLKYCVKLVK